MMRSTATASQAYDSGMDGKDDRSWAEKRMDARRQKKGLADEHGHPLMRRKKWTTSSYAVMAVFAGIVGLIALNGSAPIVGVVLLVLAVAWGAIAVIATANRISRD